MIYLTDLVAVGARLIQRGTQTSFHDFSYDSRLTQPGELFVALNTPRADGHDYIDAALAAGAAGVIASQPVYTPPNVALLQSDDPARLLQHWATRHLQHVDPHVIAVTGSVGKTSTKQAIAHLLSTAAPTFATRQSFNSLLGLPVALTHLTPAHMYAVLEFGTGSFGEIRKLARLFPPQIGVVTAVGSAHLDAFHSLEGVAREKSALVTALPANGWALLNYDDPYVAAMAAQTPAHVLRFGQQLGNDLVASNITFSTDGTMFQLTWHGLTGVTAPPATCSATLPLLGPPAVAVALAAVGVALICGLTLNQAVAQLATLPRLTGRLNPLPAQNEALLLDDSFNAAVPSVQSALQTLAVLPARRRIVLLGELADLGNHAPAAYQALGAQAGTIADLIICKGDWSQPLLQAARQTYTPPQTIVADTAAGVLHALPPDLGPGDLLLVKGSAQSRMETVAAGLLAADQSPTELLVRQEPGWSRVRIGTPGRPTWISIDLAALAHNIRRLREIAGVPLMTVLKADGYGHGAVRVARTALANGATALAVATLSEAEVLRQADITAPILVLGYTPGWQARQAVRLDVTCTIFDLDVAQALAEEATALQQQATVHVKVDTGMGRLGLRPDYEDAGLPSQSTDLVAFLQALYQLPGLHVAGLYTHFATADAADERFARLQLARFQSLLAAVADTGLRPLLVHTANSAALLRFPAARFDMVRPGIACYGLAPAPETPLPPDLRPVLSFHSEVAQVKLVPAGTPISYGGTFVTERPTWIATIPVGYADGLRRSPPWREVLVRGQRVPIVGRICMDYVMLDVTAVPGVKRGDAVVLIGQQGAARITADEVAGWLGTINYEVVATLLPRVPREVV